MNAGGTDKEKVVADTPEKRQWRPRWNRPVLRLCEQSLAEPTAKRLSRRRKRKVCIIPNYSSPTSCVLSSTWHATRSSLISSPHECVQCCLGYECTITLVPTSRVVDEMQEVWRGQVVEGIVVK